MIVRFLPAIGTACLRWPEVLAPRLMETVPFLDVRAAYLELKHELDLAIARVLEGGTYVLGPEVADFERELAAYCDAAHAVGVGNGLDALRLALLAMDIGPGDEVIVPSNTYIATWLAVTQTGATPVPVEPDHTHTLDPSLVTAAITPRTRAIIPVHLYGQPADLDPLLAIARAHGLRVLEDAAQAHGARYRGRRIGAHGDAVAWSFYPSKNLGALGDGGAVTSDDGALIERIRMLGNYGSRTRYVHELAGMNSRLDPIQAAVLRVKLRHLDAWNARRRLIADRYRDALAASDLGLPALAPDRDHVFHLFVVRTSRRAAIHDLLAARGVTTLVHYPIPPHRQGAYAATSLSAASFPIAERLAAEVLSLPIGPHLSSAQADAVIDALTRP